MRWLWRWFESRHGNEPGNGCTLSSKLCLIPKTSPQRTLTLFQTHPKCCCFFNLEAPCDVLDSYIYGSRWVCVRLCWGGGGGGGGPTCVSLDVIQPVPAAVGETRSLSRYVGTQTYAARLNQIERVKNSLIRSRTRLPGSSSGGQLDSVCVSLLFRL